MAVYVSTSIPTMDWSSTDMAESLGLFKQKMNLFLDDENITDNAAKARKICRGIGDEGLRRINASDLSPEQNKTKPTGTLDIVRKPTKCECKLPHTPVTLNEVPKTGDESIDDFVTRARTLANKCQFTANELNERLMELIIASTPYDGLRRELLGKPIGHTIKDVLKEGRKFEALSAGNDQLQRLDTKQSDIHAVSYVRKCGNCGTSHRPRQCPAYNDKCSARNAIGHWKACCRKLERNNAQAAVENVTIELPAIDMANRDADVHQALTEKIARNIRSTPITRRMASRINSRSTPSLSARNVSMRSTTGPQLATKHSLCSMSNHLDSGYTLRLKIDSGASGNTLPMRTFRQMYGDKADTRNLLEPANGIKLTAYNGEEIRCM